MSAGGAGLAVVDETFTTMQVVSDVPCAALGIDESRMRIMCLLFRRM